MYLSRKLLQKFVDISDISNEKLQEEITLHIAEVEQIGKYKEYLDSVVLGEVVSYEKIKDSKHLHIAKVDIGKKTIDIVFGSKFPVKKNYCYPIALPGTVLPGGTITESEVGGAMSQGMICSNSELELEYNTDGLIEMDSKYKGEKLLDALELVDDYIEIDNKSITHRPDLWSHVGFARDIAAIFDRSLKKIDTIYPFQDERVITAKITKIRKHPDADKLNIATVETGNETKEIICGAPDIFVGQIVPLATNGAVLPNGIVIKKAKIRGIESDGMLCSSEELCVPKGETIIVSFDEKTKLGIPINDIYYPELSKRSKFPVSIEDKTKCSKYFGAEFENIKVTDSPTWLKASLLVCGMRPINTIVDTTNYILAVYGQPQHAFDIDSTGINQILVRNAKNKEKITTLDSIERTLSEEDILITDGNNPIALAGIMGGENTETLPTTSHILIESATFDPITVRKTSQRLQLRTEAVQRYEKFPDTRLPEYAIKHAIKLIQDLHPEAKFTGVTYDYSINTLTSDAIKLSYKKLCAYAGTGISPKLVQNYLERLGFVVIFNKESGIFDVNKPFHRSKEDISIPEDLIEEVLRLFGYHNIKPKIPSSTDDNPSKNIVHDLQWKLSDAMVNQGFIEVKNYSFGSQNYLNEFGFTDFIEFMNPVSNFLDTVRPSLVPQLIANMENSLSMSGDSNNYFEFGTIYDTEKDLLYRTPDEKKTIPYQPVIFAGLSYSKFANTLLQLKDILLNSLTDLKFEKVIFEKSKEYKYLHPYQAFNLFIDGSKIGHIGLIHPTILQKHKLNNYHVSIFEINLTELAEQKLIQPIYKSASKFPPIKRDYAFVTPEEISIKEMTDIAKNVSERIVYVGVFDVYRGKSLPENTKSVAMRILYSDPEKTMKDKDIEIIEKKLILSMNNIGCKQR